LVTFGKLSEVDLFDRLAQPGKRNTLKIVASVAVHMEELPRYLRRLVGYTWVGLHEITFGATQVLPDGTRQVYWMDPMGRSYRGYVGEWVNWADVQHAIVQDGGLLRVMWGVKKTAI
jgi:hypothetical protein